MNQAGDVFSGGVLQVGQADRMFRGTGNSGLYRRGHYRRCQPGICACGVDDLADPELLIIIYALGQPS